MVAWGAATTVADVCFTDGMQHGCAAGATCNADGACVFAEMGAKKADGVAWCAIHSRCRRRAHIGRAVPTRPTAPRASASTRRRAATRRRRSASSAATPSVPGANALCALSRRCRCLIYLASAAAARVSSASPASACRAPASSAAVPVAPATTSATASRARRSDVAPPSARRTNDDAILAHSCAPTRSRPIVTAALTPSRRSGGLGVVVAPLDFRTSSPQCRDDGNCLACPPPTTPPPAYKPPTPVRRFSLCDRSQNTRQPSFRLLARRRSCRTASSTPTAITATPTARAATSAWRAFVGACRC